jgi:hypothetical protein
MFRASLPSYFTMHVRKPVHGLRRIIFLLMLPMVLLAIRYYMPGRSDWMSKAVKIQAERLQRESPSLGG